ncbi:MAG: hypothetical protein OXG44_10405 [Gammaproteobacteria bacterium]|nr:hypothetical protein [Gammaproteobacteria bacterium]
MATTNYPPLVQPSLSKVDEEQRLTFASEFGLQKEERRHDGAGHHLLHPLLLVCPGRDGGVY